ncbi:hypothetical protein OAA78_02940 [Flavobacteriaceae bacterium]|jgi:hypothetical protein|nr:hypothetical protein [Flavobacteriaceae bacterium]MDC1491890.1 hypothetical protein [Flavobacteriaceae bacterium]
MNTFNRFIYYLIGFIFGVIILNFIWDKKNTEFSYGPEARVLKNINSKNIHYSAKLHTAFQKNIITASNIQDVMKNGDVNFSKSDTKLDSCKIYVIEMIVNEKNLSINLENCTNEVKVFDYSLK